jgi:hypothetical protein
LRQLFGELFLDGYEGERDNELEKLGIKIPHNDLGLRVRDPVAYRLYEELDRRCLNLAREYEYLRAKAYRPGEYVELQREVS